VKRPLSEYLREFFVPTVAAHPRAVWQPAADVYRCEQGWLVKFDLAGVRPEEIEIQARGAKLVVSGTRRDWCITSHQHAHSMEIAYSYFERSVELPEELSGAEIRSEYQDGMLLVHVVQRRENR
jgi:HSP20 family protein